MLPLTQNPSIAPPVNPETPMAPIPGTTAPGQRKKKFFSHAPVFATLVLIHGYAVLTLTAWLAYWWTGLSVGILALVVIGSALSRAQSRKTRIMVCLVPLLVFCGGFGFLFFLSQSLLWLGASLWLLLNVEWHRLLVRSLGHGGLLKVKMKPLGVWMASVATFTCIATWYHVRIFLGLPFGWFFAGVTLTVFAYVSILEWFTSLEDFSLRLPVLITMAGVEIALALEFLSLSVFPRGIVVVSFLGLSLLALRQTKPTAPVKPPWRTVRFPLLAFLGIVLLMFLTARWK